MLAVDREEGEMDLELLQRLLIKANKLGAKGYQVLGWQPPTSATDDPDGTIYYTTPENRPVSLPRWFE